MGGRRVGISVVSVPTAALAMLLAADLRGQVSPVGSSPSPPPPAVGQASPPPPAPASPGAPSPRPVVSPAAPPRALTPDQIRARERMALISVSTVLQAQRSYAALNGALFDSITCLTRPSQCIPGQSADTAPTLDPTYQWLEPRLGYVLRFHPGPGASLEEIRRLKASPSSVKAFAVTIAPEHPGLTGGRAFCGDSRGRMCFTDGPLPPVKDGRCEPCKKLQ